MRSAPPCRSCGLGNLQPFLDLGCTPLADALVVPGLDPLLEARYPLEVAFCPDCTLVQILEEVPAEVLFVENYLYFSSFSDHLLDHSRIHALGLVETRGLGPDSLAVELASNDGYLLKNFVELGIPVLGIDPAPDQARTANANGVPTLAEFFGADLATTLRDRGQSADVIIANNVMAHVPDLNDFVEGMRILIKDGGVITVENPYVRDLIEHCEFDTIYHEHFCYFSCSSVDLLMRRHGLFLNDVEYFPELHGGTLRYHIGTSAEATPELERYLREEQELGVVDFVYYERFADRVQHLMVELTSMLRSFHDSGARVAAYGAAAKGATLMNSVGIGRDLVDYVVDRNVHKHGRCMPGTRQPIRDVSVLAEDMPDYVLLLAWNFRDEIMRQQAEYLQKGGKFVVPVPEPEVIR